MLARRSAIRIAAYFSVGFVLIFFGKISKAELFHNYSRSLSDIGVRNSQDISQGLQATYQETVSEVALPAQERPVHSFLFSFFNSFIPQQPEHSNFSVAENTHLHSGPAIYFWSRPCMAP